MKRLFLILLFLCNCANLLKAQPFHFRHYQVEQGLSYNSVFSILQDSKGFLWFGTKDGLNRFDGYNFKVFRNDPKDQKSIGNNVIRSICEDKSGSLWIGTSFGLYLYQNTTEVFKGIASTRKSAVWDLLDDREGSILFISNFTIYRYNKARNEVVPLSNNQNFEASSICFTADGTLWASTRTGEIQRYNKAKDYFEGFDLYNHSSEVISKWIDKIYPAGNSILIGTSHQGVKLFDIKSLSYRDVLTFNQDKTSIYAKNFLHYEGDIYWIATESGVFVYNISTGKYANLRKNFSDPYAISDNAIYALSKDKEGGVWVGTYFGGVNYYPKPFTSFDKFFAQGKGKEKSLSGNAVREITKDKFGNLWIGTEDAGLNKLAAGQNILSVFSPDGAKTNISHTNIHALMAVDDELWIGTYEQGLDVMNIRTGKVVRHYEKGAGLNSLNSNFIECIYRTRAGQILVGTAYGLYQYNTGSNDFTLIKDVPDYLFVMSINEDKDGNIWVGPIREGLYFYNPVTRKKGFYKYHPEKLNSLSNDFVNNVFIAKDNTIWVSTENGLNKLDKAKGTFTRYGTDEGFPSNVFYRIEEDEERNLWLSTSKGLVCFNPITEKMRVYTKANGLLNDQFNYNSSFKDDSGKMFFGSVNGMIAFNPSGFVKNAIVPEVQITGFQVFNEELRIDEGNSPLKRSITFTDQINLTYDQSTFSIDFAAPVYTDYETAEYAYKLEGVDKDYTYLKKNRKVFYTKLSPGIYTFLVKATNSSGQWNETPRKLTIRISPPFWLSIWAYIFYLVLCLSVLYFTVRYFNNKVKLRNQRKLEVLKNQKEKELYEAKIEFFTQITHEIRTPLTLIKGPIETVINKFNPGTEVLNYLHTMEKNADRLLDLTNQLLDFRKIESKEYQLHYIKSDVCALLHANFVRFEAATEGKKINYEIQLPENPVYASLDSEAVNKILSNLLSNAVKYAKSTINVKLEVCADPDETLQIIFRNDGYLIPYGMRERIFESFVRLDETSSEVGTGIGLALARSLAKLHSGKLSVHDEGGMNVFVLSLPIQQKQESRPFKGVDVGSSYEQISGKTNSLEEKPLIVLVDDNLDIIDYLSGELGSNYNILKAANGFEALGLIKTHAVQLVVSDVMMPLMDGFELCTAIKADIEISHIPVILLTAKTTSQSKITGLEIGADAYMEKPFSPNHLMAQIQSLLNNRAKLRAYFASSPLIHLKSIAHSKPDEILLDKLNSFIVKNLSNRDLDVDQLADIMNMSRATFYRKVKSISNLSPNELINITRLKRAAELLIKTDHKIQQVADMTGFSSQAQFGRSFTKQFGITPSAYVHEKKQTFE
ncbi:hybrid sensor histidine kinase/response regulator transcription factor [Pedobacter frigoris]|uniref:hybrid sensor histidine kinase/response regulator transcription factor n=1 Tax=Pedobacter frigoris TaxID=2571272 RepID=UPI001CED0F41|nr:hybrid sensor histidine kinase/response regulator transcription factor [Pedobacter frigoris]